MRTRNVLFKVFALLTCVTAIYHLLSVFYRVDETPAWRHLVFFLINCFCVYGVLKRPAYFVYLFAVLVIQQYYSHGTYVIRFWHEKKQVHWVSVFILLLLPIALICLIKDRIIKMKRGSL